MANGNGISSDLLVIHEHRIQSLEGGIQKLSVETSVQTSQLNSITDKLTDIASDVKEISKPLEKQSVDIAFLKEAHKRNNNNKTWIISTISGGAAIVIGSLVDALGHLLFHLK